MYPGLPETPAQRQRRLLQKSRGLADLWGRTYADKRREALRARQISEELEERNKASVRERLRNLERSRMQRRQAEEALTTATSKEISEDQPPHKRPRSIQLDTEKSTNVDDQTRHPERSPDRRLTDQAGPAEPHDTSASFQLDDGNTATSAERSQTETEAAETLSGATIIEQALTTLDEMNALL